MLKKITLGAAVLVLVTAPLMAQEEPPPEGQPHLILQPPPETEKPEDVGEPPEDPEAAKLWLTGVFHSMMDTDGSGGLDEGEFSAWVADVMFGPPPPPPPLPDAEFAPAFPVTFWDLDDFVTELDNDVAIIDFDVFPSGDVVPTDFNLDKSLAGTVRTGYEWQSLGAIFPSPVSAALRTVSTVEHYPPPHMDDPMVDLYFSEPNSLTMGAAPFTPPLAPADNNNVVDENNDSLIIQLVPPRAAIGFFLVDQDPGDPPPIGESIVFIDEAGFTIETISPLPTAIYPAHQFVGITSYGRPIAVVEINEAPMGFSDDISIDHVVLPQ